MNEANEGLTLTLDSQLFIKYCDLLVCWSNLQKTISQDVPSREDNGVL